MKGLPPTMRSVLFIFLQAPSLFRYYITYEEGVQGIWRYYNNHLPGDDLPGCREAWSAVGYVLRSLGMGQEAGESMAAVAIFNVVRKRGATIGKDGLAPHDLRRTYAQIGFEEGVPITQLSVLLGHASVETTRRYLNLELDLDVMVSDFVPF